MVLTISSANSGLPTRRNAPAICPAFTVRPPSRRWRSTSAASARLESPTCVSIGLRLKNAAGAVTSAAAGENKRSPCLTNTSAAAGMSACFRSYSDVPNSSSVVWFVAFGLSTTNCLGMTVFSAYTRIDCSGDKCHSSPKRSLPYRAQNSQNEAYHSVLSLARALGLDEITQPLITSWRNPFCSSRSRWVRVKSSDRNTRRPPFWRSCRTARDSASFSFGGGIMRNRLPDYSKHLVLYLYKHIMLYIYNQIMPYVYKPTLLIH